VSSADHVERLARIAYEAHRGAHPASLPPWEDATEQEQGAWRAAMSAVASQGDVTMADGPAVQSLVIDTGDQRRKFQADFTAGRQGTLVVHDDHASSHHARFRFAHGLWYVEDLDSTNGTWLNGHRIFSAQRLKKGDKIRIGRTLMTVVSA
jgi:pSer/pThr/pTyr-binding forkhead associated (FHA) protein